MSKHSKPVAPSRSVGAGEFKARCLELMKDVQQRHQELVVTKHGKPMVKIIPCDIGIPDQFGSLKGSVKYKGDIVSPDKDSWGENA